MNIRQFVNGSNQTHNTRLDLTGNIVNGWHEAKYLSDYTRHNLPKHEGLVYIIEDDKNEVKGLATVEQAKNAGLNPNPNFGFALC